MSYKKQIFAIIAIIIGIEIAIFFIGARYGDIRTLRAELDGIKTEQNVMKIPSRYKKFSFVSQMADGNIVTICVIYDKDYLMSDNQKTTIDDLVSNTLSSPEIIDR